MPRGISRYDEARLQGQLLTPEICAARLRGYLRFWYNADHLTLDGSGLVEAAKDLTGRGNDGSQTTAANRLDYYPEDPMHACRASFGSSSSSGKRHLYAGIYSVNEDDDLLMSVNYKDGVDTTFDAYSHFVGGSGLYGYPRIMGTQGNANLWNTWTFTTVVAKNGKTSTSNTILPLPTSVCRFPAAEDFTDVECSFFSSSGANSHRVLIGTCRNAVLANTSLGDDKRQLIEGVMAWDSGIAADLVEDHPFVNRPPLIGD